MVEEPGTRPAAPRYHADAHALVNRLRQVPGSHAPETDTRGPLTSDQTRLPPLLASGCRCAPSHRHPPRHETPTSPNSTATQSYRLVGLTCGHCVASVTEENESIQGITAVQIDLIPGGESRLTISSDHELAREQVEVAVTAAGYRLVEEATA